MKKAVVALVVFALGLWAMPQVFAACGIDHSDPDGQTLMDAAAALEGTDPDLAAKVKAVAIKTFPEQAGAPAATQEHGGAEPAAHEHGGKEHGGN